MTTHGFDNFASEYDTTAALAELDRVLRSSNLSERCDGIVKLPQLFEKYPFPLFITSTFLKLVEAFRNGSNLTRKWILYVAERSEKHLDKIISRDELMKRILTVSHSNDPNARALTMKLFAYFARVLADRKQMHHLIVTSLDSNDIGELHAAIFAAQRFAKHSPEFGKSVFDKATQMLLSIDVPPETKLLIVPIFEHFYSDAETSQKAIMFCRDQFLPQCHSSTIIGAVLTSLTKLAVHAVTVAPIQLALLLSHVASKRISKRVILTALGCLHYLVRETPHLWSSEALDILCSVCDGNENSDGSASLRAFAVLATLTKSNVVRLWSTNEVDQIVSLCSKKCYSNSYSLLSLACVVAMNTVENLGDCAARDRLLDTLTLALTSAISTWPWNTDDGELLKAAKSTLRCVIKLAKMDSIAAQTMSLCLLKAVGKCSDSNRQAVTECILALCDADVVVAERLQRLQMLTPTEDDRLGNYLLVAPKSSIKLIGRTVISPEQVLDRCSDGWKLFLLGRRAFRYGYATVARIVFNKLLEMTSTEHHSQWIKALVLVATAEEGMVSGNATSSADRLAFAIYNHHLALINMRAAVGNGSSHWFAIPFLELRRQFLSAVKELHTVWNVAVLIPPSASATDNKISRLITQLEDCEKRFTDISHGYDSLIRRCLDADDGTIDLLKLLRTQSFMLQQAIRSLFGKGERKKLKTPISSYNAQTGILSKHLDWLSTEMDSMHATFNRITKEAVHYLLAILDHVCFDLPFFAPRFFFQTLQTSTVKLVLNPKPSDRDNTLRLPSDQRLLLGVEGVMTVTGSARKISRGIEHVIVKVTAEFTNNTVSETKPRSSSPNTGQKMEKTVLLLNDYFSADFVLDLPSSGTVHVHVDLIDENGIVWDGNADEKLRVKILGNTETRTGSSIGQR